MGSPDHEPDIRLDQLARETGMSPILIRAWERRYGFPEPVRTRGGHRRYTPGQLEQLRRASLLVRSGFRAAEAIARARTQPEIALKVEPVRIEELAALMLEPNAAPALDRLRGAWLTLGLDSTVEDLVMPALRHVGLGWESGRLSVAEEHIATGVVSSFLGAVRAELPQAELGPPRYVIATPEGEEHGVGVWALDVLLRTRGVSALALGVSVPSADVVEEVRRHEGASLVLGITRADLLPTCGALAASLRAAVYVGGAGAVESLPASLLRLPAAITAAADFLAAAAT